MAYFKCSVNIYRGEGSVMGRWDLGMV